MERILRTGVWETLAAHLSENEIFWDIGALIGSVTVRAALDSRIQSVHSFEPSPIILPSLRTNIEFNKLNQVKIYPFGHSEKSGTFPLYFGLVTNRGMTSLNKTSAGSNAASTLVVLKTVDQVVESGLAPRPTLS